MKKIFKTILLLSIVGNCAFAQSQNLWGIIKHPQHAVIATGQHFTVYGQVFVEGVTGKSGQGAKIEGQLGIGTWGTDASQNFAAWFWETATFKADAGYNDEYEATITPPSIIGEYAYSYRFRYNGGNWIYCNLDGSENYTAERQGKLTVATTKPAVVDWGKMQFPAEVSITPGTVVNIYALVFVAGITELTGKATDIEGELGFGPYGTNASQLSAIWMWTGSSYHSDQNYGDEYVAQLNPPLGEFAVAYRFRYKMGEWIYCNLDGSDNYTPDRQAKIIVAAEKPATVDWCKLHAPAYESYTVGQSLTVSGWVYVAGKTEPSGAGAEIQGQLGYGPYGTDGSLGLPSWTWFEATYNTDINDNDEYITTIEPPIGKWNFTYRFRYKSGGWKYCDLTGSDNEFNKNLQGTLEVTDGAGVAEPSTTQNIWVYPNPTRGELRIENGEWRMWRYSIFMEKNYHLII